MILHNAEIHGRRRFDVLYDIAVLRHKAVKPSVKEVIETNRKVRVGGTVTHGFRIFGAELIEVLSFCNVGEGREGFIEERACEFLKTAVGKFAEFKGTFQGHLRCCHSVINRGHDYKAESVGDLRLKRQVVCDFDYLSACKKCSEKIQEFREFDILTALMCHRYINTRAFLYGEGATYDMCFMCIECGFIFVTVFLVWSGFIVESYYFGIADVISDAFDGSYTFIVFIHSVASVGRMHGEAVLPDISLKNYLRGSITSPVAVSTNGTSSSFTRSAEERFAA